MFTLKFWGRFLFLTIFQFNHQIVYHTFVESPQKVLIFLHRKNVPSVSDSYCQMIFSGLGTHNGDSFFVSKGGDKDYFLEPQTTSF